MSASGAGSGEDWQRLSRRMLLIHPINEAKRLFPVLLGLIFAGTNSDGPRPWWFSAIGAALVIGASVLRWATTRFRFTADQVQLQHGLVHRKVVAASTDRVRSVDVTSPPIHRLLGLSKVRVGTGAGESHLELDGLPASVAASLRVRLLHRATPSQPQPVLPAELDSQPQPVDIGKPVDIPEPAAPEHELVRLDPGWIRFAPLSPAGMIAAWVVLGLGYQGLARVTDTFRDQRIAIDWLEGLGVLAGILVVSLIALALVVVLTMIGYVLSFWGFRLTRDGRGNTLQVTRGLLTTRSTSLEIKRIRGVALREPATLRLAHGAHLTALATGVSHTEEAMSSQLTPAAPRPVVAGVAEDVLGAPGLLDLPIRSHGPAAIRRRWTRAAVVMFATCAVLAALSWWPGWRWPLLIVPLVVAGSGWLARDRAARLGHLLTGRWLVIRTGGMAGATVVLERTGAVAVTVRSSYFQRRAGLATLVVATAAGTQSYAVRDVPIERARELTRALLDRPRKASNAAASDPAGQPHTPLPMRQRNDLGGPDRPEERERGGD